MLENNEVVSVAMKRIYFRFVLFVGFFVFCFVYFVNPIYLCMCYVYKIIKDVIGCSSF